MDFGREGETQFFWGLVVGSDELVSCMRRPSLLSGHRLRCASCGCADTPAWKEREAFKGLVLCCLRVRGRQALPVFACVFGLCSEVRFLFPLPNTPSQQCCCKIKVMLRQDQLPHSTAVAACSFLLFFLSDPKWHAGAPFFTPGPERVADNERVPRTLAPNCNRHVLCVHIITQKNSLWPHQQISTRGGNFFVG